jgi:hypothetical protein
LVISENNTKYFGGCCFKEHQPPNIQKILYSKSNKSTQNNLKRANSPSYPKRAGQAQSARLGV